jgi:hypothetical protein
MRCYLIFFGTLFSLLPIMLTASDTLLVYDNFEDFSKLRDASILVNWGDHNEAVSCFELGEITDNAGLSYQSIYVHSLASPYATYHPLVNGKASLRTMTFFDYVFPVVDRSDKIVSITFDALWNRYDGGYGETGRLVVTLVDDYPEAGLRRGDIDSLQLEAPFGRPKYNLRLRNSQPVDPTHNQYVHRSPTFMLYGGGHDVRGEFEKSANYGYWMPGFSSEAGGGAPGQPSEADYPTGVATKKSDKPWEWHSISDWYRYTWVIEPEIMRLYMRPSAFDVSQNQLISQMVIPRTDQGMAYSLQKINEVHGTTISSLPPLYAWHDKFNAIRVYFRGFNDNIAYLANFSVSLKELSATNVASAAPTEQVVAYPNPAPAGLIRFSADVEVMGIYDMHGRLVYSGHSHESIIDLSGQGSGMYFYMVKTFDGQIVRGKVMVL